LTSHRKGAEKLPPKPAETAQFDAQTLHEINFEIISRLLKIWREYKDRKENRLKIFNLGAKLHAMIVDSIKIDPDIQDLKKLHEMRDQLQAEYEEAKRNGLIGPGSKERVISQFIEFITDNDLKQRIIEYARKQVERQREGTSDS